MNPFTWFLQVKYNIGEDSTALFFFWQLLCLG